MANVLIYIILVLCSHRSRLLPFRTFPSPRQNHRTSTIPKIGVRREIRDVTEGDLQLLAFILHLRAFAPRAPQLNVWGETTP